ncbi:EVI2A protein, partial [Crypturellus undulatus]|nr:EVI2A protein [Crypturellus undulatus]
MKTERCSKGHFAFFAAVFFSLCVHVSANHTAHPTVTSDTWNSSSPNPRGSLNASEGSTEVPSSTAPGSETAATWGKEPGTPQPRPSARAPRPPTPSPATRTVSAGPRDATKARTTVPKGTTKETCEDNKPLILICFIVIAVLLLICTFLLLSTVVLANKLSYLKKAKQGKRAPRSNGDFLAANSFWPSAAGTWHRLPREAAGTDLLMQELVAEREAVLQSRAEDTATRHLAMQGAADQPDQETRTPGSVLANFVVEI